MQALGFFPVSLFISTYTSSLSSATLPSRLVLALFNAASVLFLILFGRFSDSYPYPYVIMASGIGCALASFVFWGFASSLAWIFAFATVFGGFVSLDSFSSIPSILPITRNQFSPFKLLTHIHLSPPGRCIPRYMARCCDRNRREPEPHHQHRVWMLYRCRGSDVHYRPYHCCFASQQQR